MSFLVNSHMELENLLNKLKDFNISEILDYELPNDVLKSKNIIIKLLENEKSINEISKKRGVYWIITNEMVNHSFHPNFKKIPKKIIIENINNKKKDDEKYYSIIYNGSAMNIRDRVKQHLLRTKSKGMSGISIDVLINEKVSSHTKCIFSCSNKKHHT